MTVELPYFDAARFYWMGSQLCIAQSFFLVITFSFSKKQVSGDLRSLSTRMVSCP